MAKQTDLFLHAGHNVSAVTFVNADGTSQKTLFTAGANDSDLKFLNICSTDTSAVNMQFFYYDGSTSYLINTTNVPTLSGTNGTAPAVNPLNSTGIPGLVLDAVQKPYLIVKAGHSIKCAPLVTVTSTKTVTIIAAGHDY